MIFYFDFAMWLRMLRLAWREPNTKSRRQLLVMLLAIVPIVSTLHAIFFALDYVFFPGLRTIEVRTPVFITGHARSGTTLTHRLMCSDPGRFSYFRLYEMFFPSLIEKKILRGLGWIDERLGSPIGKRLEAAEKRSSLSETQDMHRTGLKEAEEDDFVLTFSMASGFWIVMAPYMGELDFYYIDERTPAQRRRLMQHYKGCVKRQLYLNGSDKIHLSKNPVFTGRIESIIETFPDARIVVMMRDPSDTIPSLLKLLQRTWKGRGWDKDAIDASLRVLADQSFHAYRYPLEALERHPEVRHAVVDYRDLIASPNKTLQDLYATLGLEMTDAFRDILTEQERRSHAHETTYRYSLEEFGLRADAIRTELADLFERYKWQQEAAAP